MIFGSQYEDDVRELRELYNTAEADLKNVGREQDALIVTGVNQCRYVGQHLLRALVSTDEVSIRSNLDAAKKHAQRAIYDINDSAIQFYIRRIDDFRDKHFPTVDFASIVPNYGSVVDALAKARRLVEMTSGAIEFREKYYNDVRNAVASLRRAHDILLEHKPDFTRAIKRENHNKMLAWIGVAVTSLAAFGSLVLIVLRSL